MDTWCHLRVSRLHKNGDFSVACAAHMWLSPTGWHLQHTHRHTHTAQRQTTAVNWQEQRVEVGGSVCKVYSHENMKALATNCLTSAAIESTARANAQRATCNAAMRRSSQRAARFKRMQITIVEHKWCRNKHECRCKSVDKSDDRGERLLEQLLLLLLLNP